MPLNEENRRPPTWEAGEAATQQADDLKPMVADSAAAERARRRWRLHLVGCRRRISVALDQRCGIEIPEPGVIQIDYHATGLDLGWPERRALGLALLEQERGWAA